MLCCGTSPQKVCGSVLIRRDPQNGASEVLYRISPGLGGRIPISRPGARAVNDTLPAAGLQSAGPQTKNRGNGGQGVWKAELVVVCRKTLPLFHGCMHAAAASRRDAARRLHEKLRDIFCQ